MNTTSLLSTVNVRATPMDLAGFASAGVWVRRVRSIPSLSAEAVGLAAVLQTWNLCQEMLIDAHDGAFAEISGPNLQPTWVYLIEVTGTRTGRDMLYHNHPLSEVRPEEPVRLVAVVSPEDFVVAGVLVETAARRRLLWLERQAARRP